MSSVIDTQYMTLFLYLKCVLSASRVVVKILRCSVDQYRQTVEFIIKELDEAELMSPFDCRIPILYSWSVVNLRLSYTIQKIILFCWPVNLAGFLPCQSFSRQFYLRNDVALKFLFTLCILSSCSF